MKNTCLVVMLLMVGQASAVAPTKYFEYVQSKQNLYVDIDYTPKCDTVIETRVSIDNDSANNTIFCSRGTTSTYYTLFHIGGSSMNFRWDYYNSTQRNSGKFDPEPDVAIDLRTTPEGLYIYGQMAEPTTPVSFTPNQKMILFASYAASTTKYAGDGNWSKMKMYSFRIFDKDEDGRLVLAYDYVPAEVNGVVGLYDRVTGAFHGSASSSQLVAGPEVYPSGTGTVSLREDVLNRGYAFTPGGTTSKSQQGFGPTNLFDGVKLVRSTSSYAMSSRWIGDEQSAQYVEIDPDYFAERAGALLSYTLHKVSMKSYAVNARTPTSWRIEGVSAVDPNDNWVVIDTRTDVVWPGVPETYVYNADENPPESDADLSLTFSVPYATQAPYRKLRFVPTNSKMFEHGGDNFYSLMELDFTVADAVAGMDADILQVSAAPQLCGDAQRYGTTFGHVAGETVELAMGEVEFADAGETIRGICTGWKLYTYNAQSRNWVYDETDPASHGNTTNCTFAFPSVAARVEWQFRMQAKVELAADGVGAVHGANWYDIGSTATISMTDSPDSAFRRWTGLPNAVSPTDGEVSFVVTGPVSATAKFSGFRWVAKTGSDDNDGSEAAPFLTLNRAVEDLGTAGGTIYIAPGTYKEIYDSALLTAVTVTNEVSIIGTGANPEDVILSVQQTGKTRHVIMLDNAWALLKNVWVKDGNQTSENWGNDDMGVNVRIGENGGVVEDCRLSMSIGGNWAQKGQSLWMNAGRVSRCRFIGNSNGSSTDNNIKGTALGAASGIIEDCLFVSNACKYGAAVYLTGSATMINCTIADNTGPNYSGVYIDSDTASAVNCIIYGNTADNSVSGRVYRGKPERFFNCYSDLEIPGATDCIVGSFPFAAPGDYHLNVGAGCIDVGADRTRYAATSATDLDGAPRVVAAQVDLGCYEAQQDELTCGFEWSADSYLAPADVTLTANVVGAVGEAVCGWTLHNVKTGEDVNLSGATATAVDLASGLYTVTLTAAAGGVTASHTVEAAFRVGPKDIFAVPENASAAFPCDSPETGTSDLAETVEIAVDGSTIHVAPGEYSVTNQLLLKQAVALVADESDPRRTLIGRTDVTTRIIQLNHPSALVAGFTLQDGLVNGGGGIAYINANGGTISNCVMRGGRTVANADNSAGAVQLQAGLVVLSTIDDCVSATKSADTSRARTIVMSGGRVSNCLIKNCQTAQAGQIVSVGASSVLENCTLVDCTLPVGSKAITVDSGTVRNCAIFVTDPDGNPLACTGTDAWNNFWPNHFVNCVTHPAIAEYTTGNGGKGWYYGKDCVTNVTAAECFRDFKAADYRVNKLGPLVDAGMNGVGLMLETDLGGHPRVRNEIIDVGCYEDFPTAFGLFLR